VIFDFYIWRRVKTRLAKNQTSLAKNQTSENELAKNQTSENELAKNAFGEKFNDKATSLQCSCKP
jgi:hypothetical protein